MSEYIEREAVNALIKAECSPKVAAYLIDAVATIPAADAIDEENVLKFYYVRSTDDYWIGQREDNFYYAEFDPEAFRWTWTHSRYLPWGEHVVSPTSLWKEHTYPSKPEEMPFEEWLRGFIKKYFPAADARPVVRGKWIQDCDYHFRCSACGDRWAVSNGHPLDVANGWNYCPNCGADMREER